MPLGRIFGAVAKAASSLTKVPVLGSVIRAVPGVGVGVAAFEGVRAVGNMIGGGGSAGRPPGLPPLPSPGMPGAGGPLALPNPTAPGVGLQTIQGPATMGGMVRGGLMAAGRRILPIAGGIAAWELVQSAFSSEPGQQFGDVTLPLSAGTATVRPPKGYVLIRNPVTGEARLMLKSVARSAGLWKASKKPPISVGQMSAIRKAASARKALARAEKLMRKACPPAKRGGMRVISKSVVPMKVTRRKVA